ncbi:MAG: N-acyl-D-amino-acid deacylase family protein [Thermodesulfobacteriota bacterium]
MATILFKGGRIVDGSGKRAFNGHFLVEEDKITAVFNEHDVLPEADSTVDASACIVSPGFIDMHSHSDWLIVQPWGNDLLKYSLEQGITTIVGGNCGFSPAPVTPKSAILLNASLAGLLAEEPLAYKWHSMGGFLECMEKTPPVLNVAEQVGHVALRLCEAGGHRGKMTDDQMTQCLERTKTALDDGACGLSFGLGYDPGMFCDTDEIEAFCRVAAETGKPVTVHMKALSKISPAYPVYDLKPHNIRALKEMLAIAERTGVRLQLSHFIFVGRHSWHLADQALELVDRAAARGVDVMIDAFPYTCGNTTVNVVFPYWFLNSLPEGYASLWKRLRLKTELEIGFRLVGFIYKDFKVMDALVPDFDDINGLSITGVARKWGTSPFKALLRLARQSAGGALMLFSAYSGDEQNEAPMLKVLSHDRCLFETDAILRRRGYPNPAGLGAFPKILGKYVRQQGILSLENAIMRMTSMSAERFGLKDRGRIAPGMAADLVVFDPETVSDNTEGPLNIPAKPDGIRYVFVNGRKMVHNGSFIDDSRAPGRVLRT